MPPRTKLIPEACWTWQNQSLAQSQAQEAQQAGAGGGRAARNVDFAASAQGWPHICHAHSAGYLPKKRRREGRKEGREQRKEGGGEEEEEILEISPKHAPHGDSS